MATRKGKKLNVKKMVISFVALYVVCHLLYGTGSIVDLKLQQRQLAQELDAAYTTQTELQSELEYQNSEDAVEKNAREKLGLIKEGEILIRHIDTEQQP